MARGPWAPSISWLQFGAVRLVVLAAGYAVSHIRIVGPEGAVLFEGSGTPDQLLDALDRQLRAR